MHNNFWDFINWNKYVIHFLNYNWRQQFCNMLIVQDKSTTHTIIVIPNFEWKLFDNIKFFCQNLCLICYRGTKATYFNSTISQVEVSDGSDFWSDPSQTHTVRFQTKITGSEIWFECTIVYSEVISAWGWSEQRSLSGGNGLIRGDFCLGWSN